MTIRKETISRTFNQVMRAHSIELQTTPFDFSIGGKCIIFQPNAHGEALAARLFDLVFPPLSSGTYYNYMTFSSFEKVLSSGNLRFFSTKKLSSHGEYIPLCQDWGLDGFWREGEGPEPEGVHTNLMDDLFYKSFVSSPKENADKLWQQFAAGGTGVRIAVKITVLPEYPDFRRVSYVGAPRVRAVKELYDAFRELGYRFTPHGLSRMPAYYQLKKYDYQNECRLIAKRPPEGYGRFPFSAQRDEEQDCNFIDCSLTTPTCDRFQLRLTGIEMGPNTGSAHRTLGAARFEEFMATTTNLR